MQTPARHAVVIAGALQRAEALLADHAPLRQVLAALTAAVETLSDGDTVASILVLDAEGLLRNGCSPSLPADYLDRIDRLKPDPHVGTCAAAAATGQIVLTPDFEADEKWTELRHLPMAIGFRGAWSFPLKSLTGEVIGTFGTYFRQRRSPTAQEIADVTALAPVAVRAIAAA
ncbi:GAF domain-containing protein [Ramlibacter algicola]|uniref:GAF domain-containing protein n=1 Tax=Ramlibacter algicola TaxID=2795217 RepID=A0A934PZE4_9BURK|nr:GAF domain-containing protein [Ramlibacter algicola]MBK0391469.1 GAF domain-containing protein [Ramlibacter algicola]